MSFPPFPADVLDPLKAYNGFGLAGDADCARPDHATDSAGAKFLLGVRDDVVERLEYMDADDRAAFAVDESSVNDLVSEVADAAPDIYTYGMWQQFVDLAAYQENPSDLGADASDMDSCARTCLYMIAERLATALFEEAHAAYVGWLDEQDDDEDDE